MKLVLILGILVLIEAAVIAVLAAALGKAKRAARALDPVDVLPMFHIKAEVRQPTEKDWEVIEDVIQYDDDRRAEKYREAWA